jgi:DNA-directed RNA polymerase subunit M/transcription elongation factor TFIIS
MTTEKPRACDDEDDIIGVDDDDVVEDVAEDAAEDAEDVDEIGVEDDDARSQGSVGSGSGLLDDEEEKPAPRAPAKKKKASSSAALSGYQHQMTLLTNPLFRELDPSDPIGDSVPRQTAHTLLQFIETLGFTEADRTLLEASIYAASFVEADRRKVICHWSNPLYKDIYNMILRTTVANLHPVSPVRNVHLVTRIRAGEVSLTDIPTMNDMEIFPENWHTLIERQSLREQRILEGDKGMATDRFRCSRCHKKECTYYEMQTRSADEPMTIFIRCLNCNKRWRQ